MVDYYKQPPSEVKNISCDFVTHARVFCLAEFCVALSSVLCLRAPRQTVDNPRHGVTGGPIRTDGRPFWRDKPAI